LKTETNSIWKYCY